jgi:hypothetical protein
MTNQDSISKYFDYFSSKNSQCLASLLSEDVVLHDWSIRAVGLSKVIEATNSIFASVETIQAVPKFYFVNSNSLFGIQVEVLINNVETINVIDVIEFNSVGKICKIIAFKLEGAFK